MWVVDSGCSNHMTGEKKMFESLDGDASQYSDIIFGDNGKGKVIGLGKVAISNDLSLSNVLYVKSLNYNLLSVSQLCDFGYLCLFDETNMKVFRKSDFSLVFQGVRKGNLYLVDFSSNKSCLSTCLMAKSTKGWLWHRRLAHVGMRNLDKILKGNHVVGLKDIVFEKTRPCSACQAGKQVGNPHPVKNIMTTSSPLELLHMDLFGPTTYQSIGGNSHGFVIVDDYSRYTWVFFLNDKAKVQEIFKTFAKKVQNEFKSKIIKVRSDNGTEFKNSKMEDFFDDQGFKHEFSNAYTPQQNGVVERKNRTLIEMARTMLDEYKTPERFWAEAINTACHASNRLYLHRLLKKTSYELLTGNKPNVSYFRVFGSKCYILNKKHRHSKFSPKCYEGFLVGYPSNGHGYRVFNNVTKIVEEVGDVKFDETNGSQVEHLVSSNAGNSLPQELMDGVSMNVEPPTSTSNVEQHGGAHLTDSENELEDDHLQQPLAQEQGEPFQVPTRIQRDHPVNQILGDINQGIQTRSRIANFCQHYSFVSSLEPSRVEDALADPDWVVAMQEELNNFERNKVVGVLYRQYF